MKLSQENGASVPYVRVSTSLFAAKEIKDGAAVLKMKVYSFLKAHGPATDEEMQSNIPMAANTQRPRRRDLQLNGLVVPTGEFRRTRAGRKAMVWKVRD